MTAPRVHCPTSLSQALALRREVAGLDEVRWLAGGQTLLAAMKHGLSRPQCLIDLSEVAELHQLRIAQGEAGRQTLVIGAMTTHARMAADPLVREVAPGLAAMAAHIADPQVRRMGTVGGSLANHDPAACWPAAMLALDARMITDRKTHRADDFFAGVYATALQDDELLTEIQVPCPEHFAYLKIEQPASRFALVGVALACVAGQVRVAVTGMGQGVLRWPQAEAVLAVLRRQPGSPVVRSPSGPDSSTFAQALAALHWPEHQAGADLHASAAYRAHLAAVLLRRLAAGMPAVQPDLPASPEQRPTLLRRLRQIWKPKESS